MMGPLNAEGASTDTVEKVISSLGSDRHRGLDNAEAQERLRKFGKNEIELEKETGFIGIFLRELREPMIFILVIIAILYSIIGDPRDSITIVVIVLIVVGIETYNLNKAKVSIDALRDMRMPLAKVIRDGTARDVKTASIVPGDIILLSAGDVVPSDGRLIESHSLKVDESSLTGESFYVLKDEELKPVSNQITEMPNMVFSGTMVVQGSGKAVVTSTGKNTELGRVARLTESGESEKTPLQLSLSKLIIVLATLAVMFSVIVPLVGYFEGEPLGDMLLTGLSMAFATVPEELPVIISITLAIGAYALSRHNAVVKDLRAAETLGSVTVIATDKTGTITENKMSVSGVHYLPHQEEYRETPDFMEVASILATGTLNLGENAMKTHKDPMEVAVFDYFTSRNPRLSEINRKYRLMDEFGFDNKLKLSSYVYETSENSIVSFSSGAPEAILARSAHALNDSSAVNPSHRDFSQKILEDVEEISSRGERVIAVAFRKMDQRFPERDDVEKELHFLGLISFIDPPREEVKHSILACQNAGIKVIMLTGDHPRTARAIADSVGINSSGKVLTGPDLSKMDDQTLSNEMDKISVYARITSEDKYRLVRLLQEKGESVAVTGDGVNDSPALKKAEIGIAMGVRGTAVAREAADMILLDDDFSTIVEAVHEGREILYTLKKSIKYEISIKLSLVMILFVPIILAIPFPFSPIQIIVMELLLDVAALGGFLYEREEIGLMTFTGGKKGSTFLNRRLIISVLISSVAIAIAVSGIYFYILNTSGNLERAQTAAFSAWVLAQLFLAHNLRTEREPVIFKGIFSNKVVLIWGILVFLSLFIITIVPPLQSIIHTADLSAVDWLITIFGTAAATFWMEAVKVLQYYLKRRPMNSVNA
jgi:Ca2+-transporting ATPase